MKCGERERGEGKETRTEGVVGHLGMLQVSESVLHHLREVIREMAVGDP